MEFNEALNRIKEVLSRIGSDIVIDDYDGLIVKKLPQSNTLDEGRTSNQTHIAITGNQMNIFPYVYSDGYFNVEYEQRDDDLKKYFTTQIPIYLHKENVTYLSPDANLFSEKKRLVYVSVVRSRRNEAADQVQLSIINMDSTDYVNYRKLVHAGTFMILLKRKQQLFYDLFSVKQEDSDELIELNNKFYKLPTNTPVRLNEVLLDEANNTNRILLPIERSKQSARQIVDVIYEIDSFKRIEDLMQKNEKSVKITTESQGGNYLRTIFSRASSPVFDATNTGKQRVFLDKDYKIRLDGNFEDCRLSTEWVSTDLGSVGTSANYLRSLINVVNDRYSDLIKIYEESGKWYLERLPKSFALSLLPDIFQNGFARRYITSLLSKPFVILTGNSGTGKTRLAKQFAEYLEVQTQDKEKNWLLVPVGADWTDNTKVLGFYNPLADEAKGKYEKTDILRLIERANQNKDIPYFLILDEMNLSHVERYFADFLSHMETMNVPFTLDGYEGELEFPNNVFVVGTVNIDETTYMFSPKVLDRANVIEFTPKKESVLDLFLHPVISASVHPAKDGTAEGFLRLAKAIREGMCQVNDDAFSRVYALFGEVYSDTKREGYEFAYRTVKEIRQYIASAYEISPNKSEFNLTAAMDEQLIQKILPKIHGNKKMIGDLLHKLKELCRENDLKLSFEKIEQMEGKLAKTQYASFI